MDNPSSIFKIALSLLLLAEVTTTGIATESSPMPSPAPSASPSVSWLPGETQEAHESRMAWWKQAKYGMFIHWGLYCIPAATGDAIRFSFKDEPKAPQISDFELYPEL